MVLGNLDCDYNLQPLIEVDINGLPDNDLVEETQINQSPKSCCDRFVDYFKSTEFLLYVACTISSWDDRGWSFAVSVYLNALSPESLVLTATYGFLSSGLVLIVGAIVGDWIDHTPRLKAVRVALFSRNICVFICAGALCFTFAYYDVIIRPSNATYFTLLKAIIVFFGVLAHLASLANTITINKDWVVVVCAGDNDKLSAISSTFRRINLVCKIFSPVLVGQVMTFGSQLMAAIFISAETLVTLVLLYFVLNRIYLRTPALAIKMDTKDNQKNEKYEDVYEKRVIDDLEEEEFFEVKEARNGGDDTQLSVVLKSERKMKKRPPPLVIKLCSPCVSVARGWRCYMEQDVKYAGFGLALLYMTVLGFDGITVGYCYSQGMSEAALSGVMAAAGVTGVLGTLVFPWMRRRIGLQHSGIISYILQISCLSLCVASVFAPGSPFNLWPEPSSSNTTMSNATISITTPNFETTLMIPKSSDSLILLLAGIVFARVGVWLVDLTTSQIQLEAVPESDRGKVNGVQESLNMLLDFLKYGLVMLFPFPHQFGLLVLLSVVFSAILGFGFYLLYICQKTSKDLTPTKSIDLSISDEINEEKPLLICEK